LRFSNLNCFSVFDQLNIPSQKLKVFLREKGMDRDYALGPYRRGNVSSGKLGKLSAGLKLGLIGFVFDNVRCSLFVVLWHKRLFLLYLCLYCPF